MLHSLYIGNKAELLVKALFESAGYTVSLATKGEAEYDLIATKGKKNIKIEVKYDMMAVQTGNIAIEFYNPKSDKPSGISITKSDVWCHCLKDGNNIAVWICNTDKLKHFIGITEPKKLIKCGGDKNASLYLYDIDTIIPIFTRLDNIHQEDMLKTIKTALK